MNTPSLEQWARSWHKAGAALEKVEREHAPDVDTRVALQQLRPAFRLAREAEPRTTTSGLVTMRRLLDQRHG